jgi:hypothetical protein
MTNVFRKLVPKTAALPRFPRLYAIGLEAP